MRQRVTVGLWCALAVLGCSSTAGLAVASAIVTYAFWARFFLPATAEGKLAGYGGKLCNVLGIGLPRCLVLRQWQMQRWNSNRRANCLLVSWAGGGVLLGGLPRAELRRTVNRLQLPVDVLFLLDPTAMSFYCDPRVAATLDQRLPELTGRYKRVVFIGNCMGATGALLWSHLATHVLAFKPVVDPSFQLPYWLGATCCVPSGPIGLKSRVVKAVSKTTRGKTCIHIYCGNEKDLCHARALRCSPPRETEAPSLPLRQPGVHCAHLLSDGGTTGMIKTLRNNGFLDAMIRAAVAAGDSEEPTAPGRWPGVVCHEADDL